jgi:hypothetical protein
VKRIGFFLIFLFTSLGICLADSFLIFEENGKVGIKNQEGQVLVPASFEALGWSDGSFSVIGDVTGYRLNNRWGILNLKKKFITKAEYEQLTYASGEFIIARKKINPAQSKTGCLNLRGEIQIPFQYDGIDIHGLRAIVFTLNQAKYSYGLVDLENQSILPLQFKNIYPLGTLRFAVENTAGKIGLYGENGRAITGFTIDSISQFHKSRAVIFQGLQQGLMDREGQTLLEPIYHSIKIIDEEKVAVRKPHEWFLVNQNNETQLKIFADNIWPTKDENIIYSNAGKYGLLNHRLEILLPAQYDHLWPLYKDHFIVRQKRKSGVIRADNSITIPLLYDSIIVEEPLLRAFKKTTGWSLLDISHTIKTQKSYEWIGTPYNNLYPVKNNGFWGALNEDGEEIIHCVFDSLLEISNDHLVVKFKNKFGIIDSQENWLVAPQSYPLRIINDSCYLQLEPQNKFLKKFTGEVIYFTDNKIEFKSDHWTEYLPDGTVKTIDYQGRILYRVEPPALDKLQEIFPEQEGMRGIKRDGKFGFIDSRGRLRIANRYDGIGNFQEGLAAIKLIGKWGFVNMQDQIVINPNFESVTGFNNGISIVRKSGKTGIIDKSGKIILSLEYDSIQYQPNKKMRLYKRGLVGLADQQGSILIEPRFDHLQELENGFVIIGREGKFGVVSIAGLPAIPPIYDALSYDESSNLYLALKKSDWSELSIK